MLRLSLTCAIIELLTLYKIFNKDLSFINAPFVCQSVHPIAVYGTISKTDSSISLNYIGKAMTCTGVSEILLNRLEYNSVIENMM